MPVLGFVPSPDGGKLAVSLSEGGSEAGTLHVYDVATAKETGDVIPRVQNGTAGGGVAWTADSRGLFYTRYPHEGERPKEDLDFYQQVWFHALGAPTHLRGMVRFFPETGAPETGTVCQPDQHRSGRSVRSDQRRFRLGQGLRRWAHLYLERTAGCQSQRHSRRRRGNSGQADRGVAGGVGSQLVVAGPQRRHLASSLAVERHAAGEDGNAGDLTA